MKYESYINNHSKTTANVKGFFLGQTNRQTNKWIGQNLYAPDLSMQGHKQALYALAVDNFGKDCGRGTLLLVKT